MTGSNKRNSLILSLVGLLIPVYLIGYNGKPITDDEQLFAGAARNIAVLGHLSADQLYGNLRLKGDYHGVEPAHPALASFWLRAFLGSNLGPVQVLYLLSIIYTIISCVLMVMIAERLGYTAESGLMIALLYGLSTMAWPYSKSFLREPLGAMLILATWFLYTATDQQKDWKKIIFFLFFVGSGIALILTKVVYGAVWLTLLIMLIFDLRTNKSWKSILVFAGIGVMGILVWLLDSWMFTDADLYYRISGGFVRDAFARLSTIPHSHFWEANSASLFSPFKGLFVYSPVLVLAPLSLIVNWKKNVRLFILPVITLLALLFVQSLAYDSEWWTPTWGSRFLLPVIPLLLVASLPLINDLLKLVRCGRIILLVAFGLGILIQLPAVLFNSSSFFAATYHYTTITFQEIYWDLSKSPLILQWQMLWKLEFDLLIARVWSNQPMFSLLFVVVAALLTSVSLRWLYFDLSNSADSQHFLLQRMTTVSVLGILLVFGISFLGRFDPYYHAREFKPLCDLMQAEIGPDDVVVVYSYPGDLWDYFSNAECGQHIWYSLPYRYYENPNSQEYQMAVDLFARIKTRKISRLWFISQYDTNYLSEYEKTEFENGNFELQIDGNIKGPSPVYYVLYGLR